MKHRKFNRGRSLTVLTTAALAAAGTVAATVDFSSPDAAADATHNGAIVTFGDSYTSNPDQFHNSLRGVPGAVGEWANDYPQTAGCLQGPNNIPNKLGERTGRPVADWSCTAQTSRSMLDRIDQAVAAGAIQDNSTVVIAIGMNDYGGFGAIDNGNLALLDPPAVQRDFLANLHSAADRIRAVAPQAEIVLSGALPTVDRDNTTFCPLNVIPDMPLGVPVPPLRDVENWNRDNQKLAAEQIGAQYVEIIDGARGHDTCAPDADRYVAGMIDTTTPDYNMVFHPSDAGSWFVANTVADQLAAPNAQDAAATGLPVGNLGSSDSTGSAASDGAGSDSPGTSSSVGSGSNAADPGSSAGSGA